MSFPAPLEILQSTLDTIGPYLPWPVRTTLSLGLRSLSSLPKPVANLLPLLLSLFALYSAVMTAYSTARYAIRTTWFFAKWGAIIAAIAWLFGGGDYVANTASGASGIFNRFSNGYYGSAAQRRGSSSWTDYAANVLRNGDAGSFLGSRQDPGILDFMQHPLRSIFSQVINFANPGDNAAPASTRRRNVDDFDNIAETASSWLANLKDQAFDALNPEKSDRWSESRQRKRNRETMKGEL